MRSAHNIYLYISLTIIKIGKKIRASKFQTWPKLRAFPKQAFLRPLSYRIDGSKEYYMPRPPLKTMEAQERAEPKKPGLRRPWFCLRRQSRVAQLMLSSTTQHFARVIPASSLPPTAVSPSQPAAEAVGNGKRVRARMSSRRSCPPSCRWSRSGG